MADHSDQRKDWRQDEKKEVRHAALQVPNHAIHRANLQADETRSRDDPSAIPSFTSKARDKPMGVVFIRHLLPQV